MAVVLIFNVLILTVIAEPVQVDAAYSKVATVTAKKVAKELIQDSAVQMAMDIVFEYEMKEMMADKYNVDDGYTAVCLDNQTDCKKPVQVKTNITTADKSKFGTKIEEILDRKVGMTGWIKWLDWIVPIFLVGTAINWLITTLDPDTEDLFDQVAKESLEELGLIKPIEPKDKPEYVGSDDKPFEYPTTTPIETSDPFLSIKDVSLAHQVKFINTNSTSSSYDFNFGQSILNSTSFIHYQRDVITGDPSFHTSQVQLQVQDTDGQFGYPVRLKDDGAQTIVYMSTLNGGYATNASYTEQDPRGVMFKDGQRIGFGGYSTYSTTGTFRVPNIDLDDLKEIFVAPSVIKKGSETKHPSGYVFENENYIEKLVKFVVGASVYELYMYSKSSYSLQTDLGTIEKLTVKEDHSTMVQTQLSTKINIFTNAKKYEYVPYVPKPDEILLKSLESSRYYDKGDTKVLPPSVVPISTPEGIQVKPDGQGGWENVNTKEPVVVPNEDELIVGDPIKTPDGEGTEIPGTNTPVPNIPDPPPPDDTITEDKFEELSCARPKKPDFTPVANSFTNAFPFSIPWDIKRFIDNAFSGIGDERPRFELTFLGDGVVLEIPEYFDNWVSFAKTFTIIVFDIGILFLFYRFMKGGGD